MSLDAVGKADQEERDGNEWAIWKDVAVVQVGKMEIFSYLEYFIRSIFHEEERSHSRYFKQRKFDIGD